MTLIRIYHLGFPGGSVVKNLPANTGDTGLIPGRGRSHMLQSKKVCAPQSLKPAHLEPVPCNKKTTARGSPHTAAKK